VLGQLPGSGCIYPAKVQTLADQLTRAGLSWKGYMEDMGADPTREAAACGHVAVGTYDTTHKASASDEYADKHNPFVYFHSIIDGAAGCRAHVVNLSALANDLKQTRTTPSFAYIVPGLCHDGHDAPCANGEPGGLVSADRFLHTWVPRILASPAFRRDGLLVITFDEGGDATACCGETRLTNGPQPGKIGHSLPPALQPLQLAAQRRGYLPAGSSGDGCGHPASALWHRRNHRRSDASERDGDFDEGALRRPSALRSACQRRFRRIKDDKPRMAGAGALNQPK
jgi:hypothetical protein